ncbi:MAG: GGDEF domain-containing protein [Gammaproteobacteria bacterium]
MGTIKKTDWVQLKDYRTYLVINTIGYVGTTVHLILVPLFYWLDLRLLALFNMFSSIMWISAWLINNRGKHQEAIILMTIEVILHTLLVVPVVGWHSGFQYYLFAAIPFTLFNNKLEGYAIVLVSLLMCFIFIALNAYTHGKDTTEILSADLASIINNINIIISFTALCVISYYFRIASLSLEKELEKQAHTDPLTGLLNRRRMRDFLEQQGTLSSHNRSALTLVFVDIDYFKQFNDTYGHHCGDFIIGAAAEFMKSQLRKDDAIARWGGEEFLIVLPDTDIDGARIIAEKIRTAIAGKEFHFGGRVFKITMTFGLSQYHSGHTIEDCLKLADMALYKGKEAGRNLVMG